MTHKNYSIVIFFQNFMQSQTQCVSDNSISEIKYIKKQKFIRLCNLFSKRRLKLETI